MIFSRAILGTDKAKMTWWNYWIQHCWMTGWSSIYHSFITWMDLVWFEDNQKQYTLLEDDDAFDQCYLEFWYGLNEDDTYPKEFLQYLMGVADRIERGEEKLIPMTESFFDDMEKELTDD